MLVAIDGPAGAGKSSVARAAAVALGATYLDTGAMYRCVALARLRDPEVDASALEIGFDGPRVLLDGVDVSAAIRDPAVSEHASVVAADARIRALLLSRQRALIEHGNWVAEGRDIGTVVAPEAELKIFLTADPAERARRRAEQTGRDVDAVLEEQTMRDARDSGREIAPLTAAVDAVCLDTTGLTLEQVVDRIVTLSGAATDKSASAEARA